jgi:hypothetical protein
MVKEALALERRVMGGAGLSDNSKPPALDVPAGAVAGREREGGQRGGLAAGRGAEAFIRTLLEEFGGGDDAVVRQEVAAVVTLLRVSRWIKEPSLARLHSAHIARAMRELCLRLEGPAGALIGDDAPFGGVAQHLALFSPAMSIMVGTDEIQRNVIGERLLGLPGEPV